jgi:hypothetical protein
VLNFRNKCQTKQIGIFSDFPVSGTIPLTIVGAREAIIVANDVYKCRPICDGQKFQINAFQNSLINSSFDDILVVKMGNYTRRWTVFWPSRGAFGRCVRSSLF